MCCQVNSDLQRPFFRVFQVESAQTLFTLPFFWGSPETPQLAQGYIGWLYLQEVQWEIELNPTSAEPSLVYLTLV